ncbi:pyridoxamine 5'-phosphate oxidase family protein [Nocardioides speluncae]|uniref:pyridoxamine 5'-phosphate oxidase family protein n=1 Tax=Nocardioides speluncae TaxID=2670337 RepID=UPI000D69A879|nr:pyridoxamine 5'-phosphate oxidase family protein [Nocardioides speluncae]
MAEDTPQSETEELQERARRIVDANHYLVLGTSEDDGSPRVSPVWFAHHDYRTFYWISSPEAQHTHNVGARPAISFVIFDSMAVPPNTGAVYVKATAEQVPDAELAHVCDQAFQGIKPPFRAYAPEELDSAADVRLYRAHATEHALHIPGRDPKYGKGLDHRRVVPMDPAG